MEYRWLKELDLEELRASARGFGIKITEVKASGKSRYVSKKTLIERIVAHLDSQGGLPRIDSVSDLAALAQRLGVRDDWHEPDEQGVDVIVSGFKLGNDGGEPDAIDLALLVMKDGAPVASINVASLLAFASREGRTQDAGSDDAGEAHEGTGDDAGWERVPTLYECPCGQRWNEDEITTDSGHLIDIKTVPNRMVSCPECKAA